MVTTEGRVLIGYTGLILTNTITCLYISYDGALDPLGRSQVVPYLEGLSTRGVRFTLITFEKPERWAETAQRHAMEERLTRAGIDWRPLRYHKYPPLLSTVFDLVHGLWAVILSLWAVRPSVIHARSYPPALIGRLVRTVLSTPFIFDMRGFYPEERVEGGLWRQDGLTYRLAKQSEKYILSGSSGIITLTNSSLPHIENLLSQTETSVEIRVIPTAVDLSRFAYVGPVSDPLTLTYFGSLGTWYMLDEMVNFGARFLERHQTSRLRFLINTDVQKLESALKRRHVGRSRVDVACVAHEEVPANLSGSSATYFFIKPTFSKTSSAPTKFAESLALGLPVVANPAVGDIGQMLVDRRVGIPVSPLSPADWDDTYTALLSLLAEEDVGQRCRRFAEDTFSLDNAVRSYASLYSTITASGSRG